MMLRWQLMAIREGVRMNHGRGFERDWDLQSVHIERCWTSWLDREGGEKALLWNLHLDRADLLWRRHGSLGRIDVG